MTIWALIPLITCVTYIALLVVILPSTARRINKVFAFYLAVAATWSFTSFMLHLNTFPSQALFWNEVLVVALIWTSIAYYHFIRAYNNRPGGAGLYFGYAFLSVLAVLSVGGYIVQYSYIVDGVLHHSLGNSIYFIGGISLFFAISVIFQLVQRYRSSSDPVERNRTVYLMTGWGILVVSAYTNLIPGAAGLPLDHIGSLVNAVIIAYAISRLRLLDIRLVARRGLAYFLLIICLASVYAGSILLGHRLFPDQPLYSILLLASALAIVLTLLARPLGYIIQETIDRFFFGETYDYRQALLSFSSKMGNILNLNELADEMLPTIIKALRIPQAKLLFEDINSNDFTVQFSYPRAENESSDEIRFNPDNPMIVWLARETSPLDLKQIDSIPLLKGLWQSEREKLAASNLELLCPIKSRGKLIGILALGKKKSATPYSHEDIQLMMSFASQAGVIIENARILDSLKTEQRRVSQLLAQAVLAQEEERQRISVDLHDSVAQWLAAASYRAQTADALLSRNGNAEAQKELEAMEQTIDKSLKELRRVVIGLRPPALDELGLSHSLRQSLEDLKAEGLEYKFIEMGTPVRLSSSMEIAVYRIVQETLSNIRKHAGATRVTLRLQFNEDRLLVEVQDDGKGFDLSQTLASAIAVGHVGLLGMKQRVEMLGGEIRIRTAREAGTTITLTLPIQSQEEEG